MIAPTLLGESLALQLTSQDNNLEIILDKKDINGLPKLILFCLEEIELSNSIKLEIHKLKEWSPAVAFLFARPTSCLCQILVMNEIKE